MVDNSCCVLMMVRDECLSIRASLESTRGYFEDILVFDTGSVDNTVEIIRETCKVNNQRLHLLEGKFKSFPESRNEGLEFAGILKKSKYILMMDAGDEFRTSLSSDELSKMFASIKPGSSNDFDIGIIKQTWLEKKNNTEGSSLSDHYDCRLIKNHQNIRYDLSYPVHEQVCDADKLFSCNFGDAFYLYQNREKYGGSSERRYQRDIEMLLESNMNKRNLYFLAQSYMSLNDFKNGFKYNVLCYEKDKKIPISSLDDVVQMDDTFTLVRIAFCAMQIKLLDVAVKYLEILLKREEEIPIDAYIYYFDI